MISCHLCIKAVAGLAPLCSVLPSICRHCIKTYSSVIMFLYLPLQSVCNQLYLRSHNGSHNGIDAVVGPWNNKYTMAKLEKRSVEYRKLMVENIYFRHEMLKCLLFSKTKQKPSYPTLHKELYYIVLLHIFNQNIVKAALKQE